MLKNYVPLYDIGCRLHNLLTRAQLLKGGGSYATKLDKSEIRQHQELVQAFQQVCREHGLTHTTDMAARILARPLPETYLEQAPELIHLQDSLQSELGNEAIFRIPQDRKDYFEQHDLFGAEVAIAFPSSERDIRKSGSCYALEQEDACVHHLMLVLERGLKALAAKVVPEVPYQHSSWQTIIDGIGKQLKALPKGPDLDFYRAVHAQFGFLKDAYRNHSEHAHDDPYDMPKALSIFEHVKSFMQALQKGGLSE